MSVEAMSWAFEQAIAPAPKLVLLAIANAANKTGYGFPGLETIVEACRPMKVRTVQVHMRTLEGLRLVRRSARYLDYGRQTSNAYQLAMPGVDTTGWGEGAAFCRVADGGGGCSSSNRVRVQQLQQGEGAQAPAPSNSTLNDLDERHSNHTVGQGPDDARDLWCVAEGIIEFLNRKVGKFFLVRHPDRSPSRSLRMAHALLVKGHSEDDLKRVIANRLLHWQGRQEMEEFLRPKTLFDPDNFEQYLGQVGIAG